MSEQTSEQPPQGDGPPPMPEPNLHYIIQTFGIQALIWTGYIPNPADGKTEPNLELARFQISLLETLEAKTRGNRDQEEEDYLAAMLHNCRMAFIGARDRLARQAEAKETSPPPEAGEETAEEAPAKEEEKEQAAPEESDQAAGEEK